MRRCPLINQFFGDDGVGPGNGFPKEKSNSIIRRRSERPPNLNTSDVYKFIEHLVCAVPCASTEWLGFSQ